MPLSSQASKSSGYTPASPVEVGTIEEQHPEALPVPVSDQHFAGQREDSKSFANATLMILKVKVVMISNLFLVTCLSGVLSCCWLYVTGSTLCL